MKTAMAVSIAVWAIAISGFAPASAPAWSATACERCAWQPPTAARTVIVRTSSELEHAVHAARPGDEILLADGRYSLQRTIEIAVPRVTVRGQSGDAARVVLHGRGMTGDTVGVAVGVNSSNVTLADLTIRSVGFHAVQVRGENGASNFTLHNAVLEDTGQQLLKGSIGANGRYAADGLIACSEFRYTTHAPSDYTNGVDILGTRRWVVRDNRLFRIRGPRFNSGPAILAWQAAQDTLIERNVILDSFRGIALGLQPRHQDVPYDHLRGVVRNNVVFNLNAWADEAIELNGAEGARVYHNTVLVQGQASWSIGIRFPSSSVDVRNNLISHQVLSRDGGRILTSEGNVIGATPAWFVHAASMNFHLSPSGARAVDAGAVIDDVDEDFDRRPRAAGRAPDAGAFEAMDGR